MIETQEKTQKKMKNENRNENKNKNEENQRINIRSVLSKFQLIEDDEHFFERITQKKQNTKVIHEIFSDINDFE